MKYSLIKDTKTPSCCLILKNQIIWNAIGESDSDRDKVLVELEQECLQVFRRKVDEDKRCRDQLRRSVADTGHELAAISSAIAKPSPHLITQVRICRNLSVCF